MCQFYGRSLTTADALRKHKRLRRTNDISTAPNNLFFSRVIVLVLHINLRV